MPGRGQECAGAAGEPQSEGAVHLSHDSAPAAARSRACLPRAVTGAHASTVGFMMPRHGALYTLGYVLVISTLANGFLHCACLQAGSEPAAISLFQLFSRSHLSWKLVDLMDFLQI